MNSEPIFKNGDLLFKIQDPYKGISILITYHHIEFYRDFTGNEKSHWVYQYFYNGCFYWDSELTIKQSYKIEKSSPPIAAGG